VTVNGLQCEVTYTITAGGTLNGCLAGPRSSYGTITSGPCPTCPVCPVCTYPTIHIQWQVRIIRCHNYSIKITKLLAN